MAIAQGINKKVSWKRESSWGTLAGVTGAQQIRRVTADFNLVKDTYSSNEIRTDYQVADMRHGSRSAEGSVNGELSPGSYSDFFAALLAREFTTGGSSTGLSLTVAANGAMWKVSRASGSWLTDGFNVGNIVRITAGTGLDAANLNNNMLVVTLSALDMNVQVLSGTNMVAGSGTAAAVSVVGKETFVPQTGHTSVSYTVEQFYQDIGQSEVYTGMKVGGASVSLPATGLVTVDFKMQGKNLERTGTTEYFTSPTAASTSGIFASVQGALVVNGQVGACVTSADFSIDRAMEMAQCVGTNFASAVFNGRISATGNLSAYFMNSNFRDYFDQETNVSLVLALTTGSGKTADAISIVFPKVKLGSSTASDAELGITQSISWTALLNDVTSGGLEATTVMLQDTSLV